MVNICLPTETMLKRKTPKQQVILVVKSLNSYEKSLYEELKEVAKLKMRIAVLLASGKDLKDLEATK